MGSIAGIVIIAIGSFWVLSLLMVGALMLLASRHDPRVVVDNPWETLPVQRQLDRLRIAVDEARADVAQPQADFERWEAELRGADVPHAPTQRRRPRPAA